MQTSTPATATDVLHVSRLWSDVALDDVLQLKRDKKIIAAQLAQLRYYCGGQCLYVLIAELRV